MRSNNKFKIKESENNYYLLLLFPIKLGLQLAIQRLIDPLMHWLKI